MLGGHHEREIMELLDRTPTPTTATATVASSTPNGRDADTRLLKKVRTIRPALATRDRRGARLGMPDRPAV